ncbi:hypothetical protein PUG81_24640 [Erwiniaceae bacterium L1_54_6]|nr:hypothetical protein [Erwiniaceae bacterium L1_54_6]
MNIFPVSVPHFSSITLANNDGTAAVLPSSITSVNLSSLQPATNIHTLQLQREVSGSGRNQAASDGAAVIKRCWQKFNDEKNSLNRLLLTLLHDDVQALRLERTGQLRASIVNAQIPVDPVSLTSVLIQYVKISRQR